ncbi:MAG: MBL fold metallo-hydrolase [Actinobacteria bacterium]|nr:MBL fold metallo-hydrolase [Actinomycetota bacterium]
MVATLVHDPDAWYAPNDMHLTRLDDYQSWLLSNGNLNVLIDPWLTAERISGGFDRVHEHNFTSIDELPSVDAVVLCTHVEDHCRPASLAQLPAHTPVHGPRAAVKVARKLGMTSTHAHDVGDMFTLGDGAQAIDVTVVRTGWPLSLFAYAYVFHDRQSGKRLFLDAHLPSARLSRAAGRVDAFLTPVRGVRAVVIPATSGPSRVARTAKSLGVTTLIPTSLDPRRDMNWWQRLVYLSWGGTKALQRKVGDGMRVIPESEKTVSL